MGADLVAVEPCIRPACREPVVLADLCRLHLKAELDRRARAYVLERDGACRSCGSAAGLQWAHILTRRVLALRWDPRNALALCRSCHDRYTSHPREFMIWLDRLIPGLRHRLIEERGELERSGAGVDYERWWTFYSREPAEA